MSKAINVVGLALIALAFWLQFGGGVPSIIDEPRKIDVDSAAVLIVYQDKDLHKLPLEQQDIIRGREWRDLLEPGMGRPIDVDAEFTVESPFKPVFERHPEKLPWVVISGSGDQYEGDLPETVAEMVSKVEAAKGE